MGLLRIRGRQERGRNDGMRRRHSGWRGRSTSDVEKKAIDFGSRGCIAFISFGLATKRHCALLPRTTRPGEVFCKLVDPHFDTMVTWAVI